MFGRLIAKSLIDDSIIMQASFTRSFLKCLMEKGITIKDLQEGILEKNAQGLANQYINNIWYKNELILDAAEGSHSSKFKNIQVIYHNFSNELSAVKVDGKAIQTQNVMSSFLQPISKFDPIGNEGRKDVCSGKSVVFPNSGKKIIVHW
jgi:hypothetical protein